MVVAEAWAEQRVLMRAYAESPDQTRPTIVLHGMQHAIGPAGTDPHGPWGIHVEPPADGRAQALRAELELAARRMARSKGNPPRLMDEEPSFDRKRTNHWAQGSPRDLPQGPGQPPGGAPVAYYEPNEHAAPAAPPAQDAAVPAEAATVWLQNRDRRAPAAAPPTDPEPPPPAPWPAPPPHAAPPAPAASGPRGSTVYGFARAADASPDPHAPPVGAAPRRRLGSLVGRTIPLGLRLTEEEHAVLDALGVARVLPASGVAALVGTADGAAWMEAFVAKLSGFGLDLIVVVRDGRSEPTYVLRG